MTAKLALEISVKGSEKTAADIGKVEEAAQKLAQAVSKSIPTDGLEQLSRSSAKAATGIESLTQKVALMGHLTAAVTIAPQFLASIQGAGRALFDASAAAERLKTQLSFSTGNVGQEMAYLTRMTNSLGLEFRSTAQAYSGFAAASRGTAMEGQKTKDVFEAISKASAVMGLSTDQSSGALLAIQQMMAKGVVSAEEFRGQLGERMPMALQAGAKALGVTTAEFSKLMESGKIVAEDFLPKFAAAITEMLGDAPEQAANRLDASVNRMANAWETLKQRVGDTGFSKAAANDMNTLSVAANAMSESIDQSAKRGEGGLSQLAGAAGILAGKTALGGIASVAEQVNWAINLLTGGVFDLSTNINLMPVGMRIAGESLATIEGRLKGAQTEYDALADRVSKAPKNIYLLSEMGVLGEYIKTLKKAREEKALLTGATLSQNYGNEGRGAAQSKESEEAAAAAAQRRAKAYAEMFEKLATPAEKASKAIQDAKESLGEFFSPEIEKRLRDSFTNKAASGTSNNDAAQAFAAEIKLAQDAAKTQVEIIQEKVKQGVIAEREGIDQTLAAQNAGFVAQAAALKSQLAKTSDSGERAKLKQEIIALGNDAAVAAAKAETGIQKIDDASLKAQQDYMASLGNETASLIAKADAAEYEMSLIGKTAEQIAVLTEARYNEQIAVQQANIDRLQGIPGSEAEISLIQEKINALERLKGVEITQPRLREQAREWERFTSDIERSLTDALMRSFESGESFGDAFINNLKNTLKSAALKLVIQTTIGTGGSLANAGINAILGTSGSNGGGGTDYLGLANTASRGYSLYSGATAAYAAYNATAAGMGAADTASITWALVSEGEFGTALGVALKSAFGTTATGASTAPVAVNSWTALAPTQTTAAEAALTAEAAGTGLGAWSSALGYAGLVVAAGMLIGKLAGREATEYKGSNLSGTFGDGGFANGTIADNFYRDGGWAHSDKNWSVNTPLNASQDLIAANDNLSLGRFQQAVNVPDFSVGDIADPVAEAAARAAAEAAVKPIQDALVAKEQERLQSIQNLMDALYTDTKAGMIKVGEAFEDSTFSEKLKAFTFSINESFDTLTLAGVGEKLSEAMGKALLPSVAVAQQTGETWGQTFTRMMSETTAVEAVLDMFGQTLAGTFGQDNMDGILKLSDHLVGLFGGVDAMNASFNNYYEKFTPEAEKTARSWEMLERSFTGLGLATPKTREEFSSLVETLTKSTDFASQDKLVAVLGLTDAVDKLVPAFEAATTTLEDMAAAAAADAEALANWKTDTLSRFAPEKTVEQAAQEVNASGLYGAPGQLMTNMDLSGFNAAITGVVANANSTTKELVDGQMGNLEIIQNYLMGLEDTAADAAIAVAALTKSLTDEASNLGVELLRAQGNEAGALAAERTIAIAGYNAEQIALYDANAATRAYIKTLGEEATEKDRIATERKGLQDEYDTLTMTSAQLLNKQRDALDESNRGLFDQINAIKTANTAMADLAQQIESIGGVRTNIGNAKQSVVAQMSTFDAPAYYEAQKAILAAQFSSAGSTTQKLDIASKWQDAITGGMQAQITALDKARDVRLKALQEESTLAEENASKAKQTADNMASALASIADYAKGLRVGNLSTLSPEDKLAAAGNEYQRLLTAAQGGDASAASKLTGASDNYLSLAKDYYASTDAYGNIFTSVEQSLNALGAQASVYEQIAATALSTYDLASATAAADAEYQASVLAIQQTTVDQFTALDTKLEGYQAQQEYRLDEQIIQLNLLNVKNEAIGDKITASEKSINASLARVAAVQDRQAAILANIAGLLALANNLAAQTASATNKTASAATLAEAV